MASSSEQNNENGNIHFLPIVESSSTQPTISSITNFVDHPVAAFHTPSMRDATIPKLMRTWQFRTRFLWCSRMVGEGEVHPQGNAPHKIKAISENDVFLKPATPKTSARVIKMGRFDEVPATNCPETPLPPFSDVPGV